jgi:anti-anti-sigma factor
MREDHLMPTSLNLDTARRSDGKVVLTATGEIDLSNVDAFNEALSRATAEAGSNGGAFTVDLSAVEYLDSSAINALFARAAHIHVIAHPLVMPVLTVSGITELVTVEPAQPAAER